MPVTNDVPAIAFFLLQAQIEDHRQRTGHVFSVTCVVCASLKQASNLINAELFPLSGLQGYWPLYEEINNSRIDLSGNDNHLGESPMLAVDSDTGLVYPRAAKFEQGEGHLAIADSLSTGLNPGTGDWSIAFLMRKLDFGFVSTVVDKHTGTTGYVIEVNEDNSVTVTFGDGSSEVSPSTAAGAIVHDAWTFVRMEADRSADLKLYVDEVEVISQDITGVSGDVANVEAFTLGPSSVVATFLLGPVMVWNRLLTGAEAVYLFNAGAGQPHPLA